MFYGTPCILSYLTMQVASQLAGVEAQFQTALERLNMDTHSGTSDKTLETTDTVDTMDNTVTLNKDSDDITVNRRVKCNHISNQIIGIIRSRNTANDKGLHKRDPSAPPQDSLRMQQSFRR